ncbi:Midasin, partial [Stegodyphus mimosarum]
MKPMEPTDFEFIATHVFSSISPQLISAMIKFNHELHSEVNVKRLWGQDGYPWEFNLRDIFRWCEAMVINQNESDYNLGEYVKLIYVDRMRSVADKIQVYKLFDSVMQRCGVDRNSIYETVRHLDLNVLDNCVQLGYSFLPRVGQNLSDAKMMSIAHRQLSGLESLMKCIEMKWMAILVGPSGSGKSTLVRLLADLTGNQLHVISVNSEMDTTELLGGFE